MNNKNIIRFLACLTISIQCNAFDVDDADSLDFESFHSDKTLPLKPTPPPKNNRFLKTSNSSKIYNVSERYSLNRSNKTPYSAFFVIEVLHKKMAKECPKGWEKIKEWSTAIEDKDFELHYQFSCLN